MRPANWFEMQQNLDRLQEREEVCALLNGQTDSKPALVEVDHRAERRRAPVVEVRRTQSETTQDRPLELADVCPLAGDQRLAGLGRLDRLAGGVVLQRVARH